MAPTGLVKGLYATVVVVIVVDQPAAVSVNALECIEEEQSGVVGRGVSAFVCLGARQAVGLHTVAKFNSILVYALCTT